MQSCKVRSSHHSCSMKKCVKRDFPKFIGKHLCQSLFLKKTEKFLRTPFLQNNSRRLPLQRNHLLDTKQIKMPFIDPRKINSFIKTYLLECEKNNEYENYEIIQQGALPDTPIADYSGNAIFALP